MKFKGRKELEECLNDKITITREDFLRKAMEVIENPFGDNDVPEEDKSHMRLTFLMTGMLLTQTLEEKLFGKRN